VLVDPGLFLTDLIGSANIVGFSPHVRAAGALKRAPFPRRCRFRAETMLATRSRISSTTVRAWNSFSYSFVGETQVRPEQDFAASQMQSLSRGLLMDWAIHGVKIVHSHELDLNTPQTSGMTRAAAITHARAGANKLWAGTMVVQPDAKTGPHHHGELETVLYVVQGRIRMRWGDQLEFSEEARPGDFIYVPPYVPHQEINASPDETCEAVVVRDGQDPIVVNLDLRTPEPASAGHGGMPFHPDH
jgi:uncharacterized RmlC-like cupin family protein